MAFEVSSLITVQVAYTIVLVLGLIMAVAFSLLVLITGKGDAMGGGSSIRTTFKGKASFDDIMSNWTLYIGAGFMTAVLLADIIIAKLPRK